MAGVAAISSAQGQPIQPHRVLRGLRVVKGLRFYVGPSLFWRVGGSGPMSTAMQCRAALSSTRNVGGDFRLVCDDSPS
jgi:hypothetical protein